MKIALWCRVGTALAAGVFMLGLFNDVDAQRAGRAGGGSRRWWCAWRRRCCRGWRRRLFPRRRCRRRGIFLRGHTGWQASRREPGLGCDGADRQRQSRGDTAIGAGSRSLDGADREQQSRGNSTIGAVNNDHEPGPTPDCLQSEPDFPAVHRNADAKHSGIEHIHNHRQCKRQQRLLQLLELGQPKRRGRRSGRRDHRRRGGLREPAKSRDKRASSPAVQRRPRSRERRAVLQVRRDLVHGRLWQQWRGVYAGSSPAGILRGPR